MSTVLAPQDEAGLPVAAEAGPAAARPEPMPVAHPVIQADRTGVLLLNLGTPEGYDYWSMRRYLSEFLSDRRVIDYPRWLWQPLLQGVVLTRRPFSSGRAYKSIWNEAHDESPLRTVTRAPAIELGARLAVRAPEISVDWAMRYGRPAIDQILNRLVAHGCRRVLLMALYPQYSATTTATAYDKAFAALQLMKWQPAIRTLPSYHDHPRYIDALRSSILAHLARLDWEPEKLIFSYHGVPRRFLLEGDPYHCFCVKTTRLVLAALGWPEDWVMTCFQSRFGPEEWLHPYLDVTLRELPRRGVKRVAVISPGFSTDCLETLEEIAERGRESFLHAGGLHFTYIPCLNDSETHLQLLEQLALGELQGWI